MKALMQILPQHPHPRTSGQEAYANAIRALTECAAVCIACADACLAEATPAAPLRRCIRTDLDCADICDLTARLLIRQTEPDGPLIQAQLHACVLACNVCAEECAAHGSHHAHCATCAKTCRHCQETCNRLLGELTAAGVSPESTT